jgi:formylglycine-generating enzyme required for sulfatase activity
MTSERWQQVEKLYQAALEREPSQRAAFLKEACAGDEALRQEVESLLGYQTQAERFIETPALEAAAQLLADNQIRSTAPVRSASPRHALVGQTVSHYRILDKLGEGGMGIVFKAQDLRLERQVALKFLSPQVIPDAEEKERFMREAKAASALDHLNIGTIHEIAETADGHLFIVMAYYEGDTLKQKIDRGPLPLEEALDMALQMARGLAKAHDRQIVHRDVKPANVVVSREGVVKVIDFGLAKLGGLTKITKSRTTMGTVAYMSPEQARGEEVDQRTDVWSLGVVLYEMLAGQLPFPGEHSEAILHAILTRKPKPIKQLRAEVPVAIEQIIHLALEKELKARYLSAGEVLKDLTEYQSNLVSRSAGLSRGRVLAGWIKQKRVAVPGMLLLLLLGSLLGWYSHRQAKIRWAREKALPEIRRLIDEEKYTAAFTIAQEAEKYIPLDPLIVKLWPDMSGLVSVHTTPTAAEVYMKDYSAVQGAWTYLGRSPLKKVRLPREELRLKAEKKGFATVETVEDVEDVLWRESPISLKLDPEGSLPPGMVRVSAQTSPYSLSNPGFEQLAPVQLADYWMDRYEVTNKQFKQFVDSGGYQKRQYWKHPFVKEGRTLAWEEALAEFHDATGRPGPSTWEAGDYPQGEADYPVRGVSWYEAAAYAEFEGKSLPSIYHWSNAAMPALAPYSVPLSNFSGRGPARVGAYQGMSRSGTYDMAGNVKEWCWNEADQHKRYILGGGWDEPVYMFHEADAHSPFHRYANFGFRCVRYPSPDTLSKTVTGPLAPTVRNYAEEHPIQEEVFRVYQSLYSYDKTALSSITESTDESHPDWKKERITLAAAYGRERVIAYLFLPKKATPPYQTITYFPGSYAIGLGTKGLIDLSWIDFILKSGRALFYPIYKGTYERGDELKSDYPDMTTFYRDHVIYWSKDLARGIDYLETRPEIDHDKIGFFGLSWGGALGALLPALETRLKVSVLLVGGFYLQKARPEVDQINFAPRVRIPTLMLNGRYDFGFRRRPPKTQCSVCSERLKSTSAMSFLRQGTWSPRIRVLKRPSIG